MQHIMKVKDVVKECFEEDIIIIRQKNSELRIPNIFPYRKAIAPYWEKEVSDFWRDGDYTMIIKIK